MGTKYIDGTLNVSDLIFENGASLASKYAKDSSVVHKGKDETITGNKTFNATNNYNGYNIFNGATNANGEKECITFPTGAILATDKELKLYTHNSYNTFGNSSGTYGLKGAENTVYDLATMVRSGEDQWSIAGRKSWSNTHAFDASVDFNGGFSSKGVGTFNNQLIANNNIYANDFIYNNKGMMGGYLELHPEANTVAFPFYMNDLAYLQKKGGSCTITGFVTNDEPTNSRIFNGKSNYSHYTLNSTSDTVTILVKTHTYFSWGSSIGINFGSSNWRAKNIKIELGYATTIGGDPATDAWATVGETTDYPEGNYFIRGVYGPTTSGDSGKKWNTIRFTLTNFNGLNIRIAGIYMFNYSSEGLNTTLLGKDGGTMYGDIVPYTHDTLQLGESGNRFKIGYFRNILENEYLESNYITTNGFMPKNGNGVGHIGSMDVKWNQVHSQYIYGDTLCENNIKLENKYAKELKVNLGRNTTEHKKTTCCSFLTLTFPDQWNTFYFNLTIKDSESRYFNSEYFIRGRASDTNTDLICEIQNVYSTNYNKSRWNIFATQNGNTMTFYVKTTDARYCDPDVFISKYSFRGAIQIEAKAGTWTENIPTETWTELTNALDSRYVQKESYTHNYAAKVYGFDNQGVQKIWNVDTTAAGYTIPYRLENGQLRVGTPTANEHATTKEYVDTNYIPKKSVNNAYQAIVDNSGAAFTVTAGLSNNTSQTKLKIAPSGIATINDKQIATTDDIPSYGNATTTTSGLMSASDKTTLTALTCKSESKDIALGLTSLIDDQTVNPITANITDRSFFSKIIDLMRAGQVVTGFYLQLGNYYTFLKLFFANLEEGYENLSFEITDANDNSCVSYGINYDASNYMITFNKRDASIADALIGDNGTTYHYNSFALSSHNQASNTINAMTNYSKPTSTSAIKATDSLNTAIGKLEKALDGKGTSNFTGYTSSNKLSTSYIQNDAKWTSNAGTVTSVRVQATSPVVSSSNTAQTSSLNTIISLADGYGDTKNPYGPKTKNWVLAAPNGREGVPSFRALVAADIPSLPSNRINAMTGYSKASSASAIKATDSLNTAIGKLEKALDGKGTSNLTLGTTATTAAKGNHTHSAATTSAAGLMSKDDKILLNNIYNIFDFTDKNNFCFAAQDDCQGISWINGNIVLRYDTTDPTSPYLGVSSNNVEVGNTALKLNKIQAPTTSNGTTYGLGTSGQVLKSNGTSVYWANDSTTSHPTFARGSTDFSPAYTLTAKDAGFIHTWWRCSSNLYASCSFGKVIAVSATNLFPMQKYSPGTNTSNQTTAYQKSVSSGSGSYSNNSSNAFQIPQRGDMVIDQYGCIGVIESDPTTVVSTYSVRLVWKSIKDWSCLEKGTQITLADGTYKNIEDVRQGESIMGWDFEKNEPCEAIALFADAAQADEKTTYLVLDNGEILSMTDGHTLYSKNLERYIPINDLREGDILMGKDGEDVEVVSIHWNIHTFGIRQFYHIVSSNNTYFANNTLNAIHPVDKYNWLQNRSSEVVPDEILAIFEQDKGEFDCFDFTIKNKEFLALTSKHQSTLKKHRNKIGDLKNYLTNTDYVAIKMFEGLEVDETILDIRKEKRKEINALEKEIEKIEKEYNSLLVQYSDLGEDMLLSDNARRSKYFKVACKNDNEHLDLFKKYYPLKDEAYILKEIEEGKANRPITETTEEESE